MTRESNKTLVMGALKDWSILKTKDYICHKWKIVSSGVACKLSDLDKSLEFPLVRTFLYCFWYSLFLALVFFSSLSVFRFFVLVLSICLLSLCICIFTAILSTCQESTCFIMILYSFLLSQSLTLLPQYKYTSTDESHH